MKNEKIKEFLTKLSQEKSVKNEILDIAKVKYKM